MLQVKFGEKSCGISAIFSNVCFMIETQVLMAVSDFSEFFLGIISWKVGSLFSVCVWVCVWAGDVFQLGAASFLSGGAPHGGIGFDGGEFWKKS